MKRFFALALCLALALAAALPARAIIEFIVLDKLLNPKSTPTPAPPPETAASSFSDLISQPIYGIPTSRLFPNPTPTPTTPPYFSNPGDILIPPLFPRPTSALPSANPKPTAKPTAKPGTKPTTKPAKKPPASKDGQQKGVEVTSFGLYFEELRPKLTDSWYMFTPLDLSVEGVMSYPLIAGNAHIVGSVSVAVQGGQVTITCQAAPGVSTDREFFTLFPSLDSIQSLNVQLLAAQARPFGQPINIQQAFGDDRKIVLYLNNTVSFNASQAGVTAFVPDQHRFFMQNLLPLLD